MGCPLYGTGLGYVRDKFVEGARVTISLSTPAKEEIEMGAAGYGGTWSTVEERYLPILGQDAVNITHAVRCGKLVRKRDGTARVVPFEDGKDDSLLLRAALWCRANDQPAKEGELMIAMGQAAFLKHSAHSDEIKGIYDWRGHLLP